MTQRIDRRLDQLGAIVERNDANARREAGLEFENFLLHTVDHLLGVFARPRHHHAADRLRGVFDQRCGTEGVAYLYRPDDLYVNWPAIVRGDDDPADIVKILNQPHSTHDGPGTICPDHITAHFLVALDTRAYNRAERKRVAT